MVRLKHLISANNALKIVDVIELYITVIALYIWFCFSRNGYIYSIIKKPWQRDLPHKARITVNSEAAGNRTETLNSSICSRSTRHEELKKKTTTINMKHWMGEKVEFKTSELAKCVLIHSNYT